MIIFRAESLSYAYEYICRMLHIDVTKHLPDYDYGVNNKFAIMLIVGLIRLLLRKREQGMMPRHLSCFMMKR